MVVAVVRMVVVAVVIMVVVAVVIMVVVAVAHARPTPSPEDSVDFMMTMGEDAEQDTAKISDDEPTCPVAEVCQRSSWTSIFTSPAAKVQAPWCNRRFFENKNEDLKKEVKHITREKWVSMVVGETPELKQRFFFELRQTEDRGETAVHEHELEADTGFYQRVKDRLFRLNPLISAGQQPTEDLLDNEANHQELVELAAPERLNQQSGAPDTTRLSDLTKLQLQTKHAESEIASMKEMLKEEQGRRRQLEEALSEYLGLPMPPPEMASKVASSSQLPRDEDSRELSESYPAAPFCTNEVVFPDIQDLKQDFEMHRGASFNSLRTLENESTDEASLEVCQTEIARGLTDASVV
eukprot:gene10325-12211_t